MMRNGKPSEGPWHEPTAEEVARSVCTLCGSVLLIRAKVHAEDGPAVTVWSDEHGYLEVLARYCACCDPHVLDSRIP